MKTIEELIASGTTAEVTEAIKSRTTQFGTLAAKSVTTQVELDEMNALDDEMEKLSVKLTELKKLDDAKQRNAARTKAFNTPVNTVPMSGAPAEDDAKKSYTPAYTPMGSLKHIVFGSRQENEQIAYKFFNWFCATGLRPDSGLRVKAQKFCEDNGIAIKTLNEGVNDQGGALVPAEFDPMLIRLVEKYGKFRQFAKIKPMAFETASQPRRTGGITTYWVSEGGTITPSNPTFDNIGLVAKKLAALTVMSSEISEDSAINLADELAFEIGFGFAYSEDSAGFIGDGSITYGGITGVAPKLKGLSGTIANIAGLQVATGTGYGSSYGATVLPDFNAVVGLLPEYADPGAEWFVHKSYFHNVMQKLELAAGGVTANEIATGDRRSRPLFLGYPVNFVQVMPRTPAVSQVCALFGDLAMAATMGDRRARTLFTDPYSLSNKDQILVRATERVDIVVHDVGNASGTAADRVPGPIVGLITASS